MTKGLLCFPSCAQSSEGFCCEDVGNSLKKPGSCFRYQALQQIGHTCQHDIFSNLCLHTAGLLANPGCLSGIRLHQVAGCEKQQQARYLSAEEFRGSSEAQFAAELQRRIRQAQVLPEA